MLPFLKWHLGNYSRRRNANHLAVIGDVDGQVRNRFWIERRISRLPIFEAQGAAVRCTMGLCVRCHFRQRLRWTSSQYADCAPGEIAVGDHKGLQELRADGLRPS